MIRDENANTAITPAFAERNVPAVFASDNAYAPLLGVALASLVRNAGPGRNYDVIILERGLSPLNRRRLKAFAGGNVSVRFVDVAECLRRSAPGGLFTSRHLSEATYYRLFMPDLLAAYDKALYLDCDLAILGDVGDLFDTELEDNFIAAAPSLAMAYNLRHEELLGRPEPWGEHLDGWRNYLTGTVELSDPYQYIQCGVLVMNLAAMRRDGLLGQSLALLERMRTPVFHDQDTLSSVCQGRIAWLDPRWNYTWEYGYNTEITGEEFAAGLPPHFRDAYERAGGDIRILHYCSDRKPWTSPEAEYADIFWEYARGTAFYEELLAIHMRHTAREAVLAAAREPDSAAPGLIKANRRVEERHGELFPPYRDAHRGRDLAVVATGPSLSRYQPLADAVHLGVNRAFQNRAVAFDYLFVQHFPGIDDATDDIAAYGAGRTKKFYGLLSERTDLRWMRPDRVAATPGMELYYCLNGESGGPAHFAADIAGFPLSCNESVIFAALQFALYTRPARLFLVGCDSTGKEGAAADGLMADWEQFRDFAARRYPEVEIVSVNPVRLAGMFKDLHQ